jgi:hypothetical protein
MRQQAPLGGKNPESMRLNSHNYPGVTSSREATRPDFTVDALHVVVLDGWGMCAVDSMTRSDLLKVIDVYTNRTKP